jgi:cation transport ATPase
MDQRVSNSTRDEKQIVIRGLKWWTWKRVLLALVVIFIVLEIGTYTLNWNWTGFKANNTLWDWLQLLLLPIALAIVPIWLMAEEGQQRIWIAQLKWVILASVVILAILFIGSYAFNWTWTGFKGEGTLWDWLSLLLVPITVAALPIWYSIHQSRSNSESIQHEIG